mgnify:CR=1 FL=1
MDLKNERKYGFFCYGSRIFSPKGLMNTLTEGKLKEARTRQMKELETMAANLDGTCGKKVHAHMMKDFTRGNNLRNYEKYPGRSL